MVELVSVTGFVECTPLNAPPPTGTEVSAPAGRPAASGHIVGVLEGALPGVSRHDDGGKRGIERADGTRVAPRAATIGDEQHAVAT